MKEIREEKEREQTHNCMKAENNCMKAENTKQRENRDTTEDTAERWRDKKKRQSLIEAREQPEKRTAVSLLVQYRSTGNVLYFEVQKKWLLEFFE